MALAGLATPVLLQACRSLGHGMSLEDISKKKCDTQDLSFLTAVYKSESVSK